MKVSSLLYLGATALFIGGSIIELIEKKAEIEEERRTWQQAVASDGNGSSSSQSSAPSPVSPQTT